jgi:hypothetical protein
VAICLYFVAHGCADPIRPWRASAARICRACSSCRPGTGGTSRQAPGQVPGARQATGR